MRRYRVAFALVVLVCVAALAHSFVTSSAGARIDRYGDQATRPFDDREQVVPPRDGVTVVTGQGADEAAGAIVAFAPDGRVRYYNATYDGYFDVDPSPAGAMTVEYVAERRLDGAEAEGCRGPCTLSVVERVNLTTGAVTRLHSRVIPQDRGANWHDVDRIGDDRLLVGDIYRDEVYVLDTGTGLTTWEWAAQSAYPIDGGGPYPVDWTHLNDVERLPDGRIMVSLRDQDQVVFLDRERGLLENWTLGADGDHATLYEQHNPDYIPADRGGPAVVVADSQNDRVIEYRRRDGDWTRAWVWRDTRLKWPRDADRLPNGHTLITDTNGHRVLEVNRSGAVVWEVPFYSPYDVERLGTGDESAGGPAATSADLRSRSEQDEPPERTVASAVLPKKYLQGLLYLLPVWMDVGDAALAGVLVLTVVAWGVVELRRSPVGVEVRWPIRLRR